MLTEYVDIIEQNWYNLYVDFHPSFDCHHPKKFQRIELKPAYSEYIRLTLSF